MDNNKQKALDAALAQIERQFGKGSIMRLGDNLLIPFSGSGYQLIHDRFDIYIPCNSLLKLTVKAVQLTQPVRVIFNQALNTSYVVRYLALNIFTQLI